MTDLQIDHATPSITTGCLYVQSTVTWPDNVKINADTTHLIWKDDVVKVLAAGRCCSPPWSRRRHPTTCHLHFWKLVGVVVTDTFLTRCRLRYLLQPFSAKTAILQLSPEVMIICYQTVFIICISNHIL